MSKTNWNSTQQISKCKVRPKGKKPGPATMSITWRSATIKEQTKWVNETMPRGIMERLSKWRIRWWQHSSPERLMTQWEGKVPTNQPSRIAKKFHHNTHAISRALHQRRVSWRAIARRQTTFSFCRTNSRPTRLRRLPSRTSTQASSSGSVNYLDKPSGNSPEAPWTSSFWKTATTKKWAFRSIRRE